MAARLRSLGLDGRRLGHRLRDVARHTGVQHGSAARQRPRASSARSATGDGPTFILNGHVDVVPIGDLTQWTVTPGTRRFAHSTVIGRGACDMKGGLAAALAALRALAAARVPLGGRVALHSVIAEEDGGAGTLATVLRGHRGDGALSMEPTELMLAPAHAGALSFRIRVPGRSAHGCVREEGVSAIETFRAGARRAAGARSGAQRAAAATALRALSTALRAVDRARHRRRLAFVRAGFADLRRTLRHRAGRRRRRGEATSSRAPSPGPRWVHPYLRDHPPTRRMVGRSVHAGAHPDRRAHRHARRSARSATSPAASRASKG